MKPPNSLTHEELKAYAEEHLQYELDMLTWSAGILAFLTVHKNVGFLPWAINNGLLNTFAIHARNLINFLYSRSKGKDYQTDIVIEDFVEDRFVSSSLVEISSLLEETLIKANKQVAHISMERKNYEMAGKEWKFIEVSKDIRLSFGSIAPHIPISKISENLKEKLSRSEVEIPVVDISIENAPDGRPTGVCFSIRLT